MTATRGAIFGGLKQDKQSRRAGRLQEFESSGMPARLTRHTENHWSTIVQGSQLEYWPTLGKWRWNNKAYWGQLIDFINFLRKRGWNG